MNNKASSPPQSMQTQSLGSIINPSRVMSRNRRGRLQRSQHGGETDGIQWWLAVQRTWPIGWLLYYLSFHFFLVFIASVTTIDNYCWYCCIFVSPLKMLLSLLSWKLFLLLCFPFAWLTYLFKLILVTLCRSHFFSTRLSLMKINVCFHFFDASVF